MSVIRTEKTSHFVAIDNAVVEDIRLTFAARGLLTFLLSKPPTWEVSISHLVKQSPAGKDHIYKLIAELEKCGYMVKGDERRKCGKFSGVDWIVKEKPNRGGLSDTVLNNRGGFTAAVKPDTDNPTQVITDSTKTDLYVPLADNKKLSTIKTEPSDNVAHGQENNSVRVISGIIKPDWKPSEQFYKDLELRQIPKPTQTQIDKFVTYHIGKGTKIFDPDKLFTSWVLTDYTRQNNKAKKLLNKKGGVIPGQGNELIAYAANYGIKPRAGESWDQLRARTMTAIEKQEGGK